MNIKANTIAFPTPRDFKLQIHDESSMTVGRKIHYKVDFAPYIDGSVSKKFPNVDAIEIDIKPGSEIEISGLLDGDHKHIILSVNGLQIATPGNFEHLPNSGPLGLIITGTDQENGIVSFKHLLMGPEMRTQCPSSPSLATSVFHGSAINLTSITDSTSVTVGDRIIFSANSNPGAGYEWEVSIKSLNSSSEILTELRNEFEPHSTSLVPDTHDLDDLPFLDLERKQTSQPLTTPTSPFVHSSRLHATLSNSSSNPASHPLQNETASASLGHISENTGKQMFEWLAVQDGEIQVVLNYVRSWNRGTIEKSIKKKFVVKPNTNST